MHHDHPYQRAERATRTRRDSQTMSHFREAVLADAQRFLESSYRKAIVNEAARLGAPSSRANGTSTPTTTMKASFL
jgi:hypothetical protein